ncbi:hypothetical protein D0962_26005 [Leptolyngbyaceae cyanobacterium CCMR0082]|uniref:Uncharacterized protein n=1 Tax=Adonisia turfae CCMR0082 TaxID=2304604 RepID=A0A6M0SCF5_9CYAN|nr:hypothetical protein [Adonisia turfae]NEZ66175.1 hypothetical protein [Adonisia turfae CCMR0082]
MFGCKTFRETAAFFTGFSFGANSSPLSGEGYNTFHHFVTTTLRLPQKFAWPCIDDDSNITVTTPDFGPVVLKLIEGQWKITPSDIINKLLATNA